jgi:hypothetical protein
MSRPTLVLEHALMAMRRAVKPQAQLAILHQFFDSDVAFMRCQRL